MSRRGPYGTVCELSTEDLVCRARCGDRRAEACLLHRGRPPVQFLVRHLVKDPELGNDVAQDTLRAAIETVRRGRIRRPERFPAFLRATAKNLLRHAFRQKVHHRDAVCRLARGAPTAVRNTPLDDLLLRERRLEVRRLLGRLSRPRDRKILTGIYLEDRSKKEVQRELDLTGPQFDLVIHRARRRLRKLALTESNGVLVPVGRTGFDRGRVARDPRPRR